MVKTIYHGFICQYLRNPNLAKYNHESKTLQFLDWEHAAVDYFKWCSDKRGGEHNNDLNSMKERLKKALIYKGKAKMQTTTRAHTVGRCEKNFYIVCERTADKLLQQINQGVETLTSSSAANMGQTGTENSWIAATSPLNTMEAENCSDQTVPSPPGTSLNRSVTSTCWSTSRVVTINQGVETLTSSSAANMEQRGTENSLIAAISQLNTMEAQNHSDQGGDCSGDLIPTPLEAFISTEDNAGMSLPSSSIQERNDHPEQELPIPEVGNLSPFQDGNGVDTSDMMNLSEEELQELVSDYSQ